MSDIAALNEKQMKMAEELLFSGKRLPSFVKGLFFGLFDSERVFPFPQVSSQEKSRTEAILKELRAWADEHLDPDAIDRNAHIPEEVIEGLGRLGVLGCTIPEEYGGLGMTQYAYCRFVEEIARRCGATTLFVNAHQSIGLKALLLFGTTEQKERWLPPLARGECLGAFALTEPNAGSDAAGIETRAVFDAERNVYVINGKKQWITNGGIAGVLTVMAQTTVRTKDGPKDKVTAFLVTPDMPGFIVTDVALEKVGMRGSKTAKLAFENLEVPAENVLGTVGGGLKMALTVLDFGRTTFGAGCTGNGKDMVERAIKHARERVQFDRPLAAFGLVKEKIARMSALVYAMDAATYMTAGLLDRGEEDFMLETAIIKVFTSECQWQIVYETMQILGGRSFFTDQPYERMMRDARLNTIGEGSNEVLRAFIGIVGIRDVGVKFKDVADSVTSPLQAIAKLFGIGKSTVGHILKAPPIPVRSPGLQGEAHHLSQAVRRFGFSVQRAVVQFRENIVEHQMVLNRIATAAIALYTITAVLSKLDSALASANGSSAVFDNDVATAKLYCKIAFAQFDQSLDSLFKNNDVEVEALSDRLTKWK